MTSSVESERVANALLLFYEKARPREFPPEEASRDGADKEQEKGKGKGLDRGRDRDKDDSSTSANTTPSSAGDMMSTCESEKLNPPAGLEGGAMGMVLDGVEAFSDEVWQANVQFMLHSYVFDTEFHHFLRNRVLRMGVTLLLDIILHSRERRDIKTWQDLLASALTTSPELCRQDDITS
ncbi:unnamed protein product [Discosporangium mesarthrocarpum]